MSVLGATRARIVLEVEPLDGAAGGALPVAYFVVVEHESRGHTPGDAGSNEGGTSTHTGRCKHIPGHANSNQGETYPHSGDAISNQGEACTHMEMQMQITVSNPQLL
jgi:hypothetical protein